MLEQLKTKKAAIMAVISAFTIVVVFLVGIVTTYQKTGEIDIAAVESVADQVIESAIPTIVAAVEEVTATSTTSTTSTTP